MRLRLLTLYSIEGIEIQEESEYRGKTSTSTRTTDYSDSVKTFFEKLRNVKQNSVSKVLDENGEPLVVYHGTDAEFNVFDK